MSFLSSVARKAVFLATGLGLVLGVLALSTTPATVAQLPPGPTSVSQGSETLELVAARRCRRGYVWRNGRCWRKAPDYYTPYTGAVANNPLGTIADKYRIFTHINRMIRSAPYGSTIRIAVFSFSDMNTANNLIAAHRRGVNVRLIFDQHAVFPAESLLISTLGSNINRRSFAKFCSQSCRSSGGEMHAKVFQFSRSGRSSWITLIGSNNLTSHNAERQWSDVTTIAGDLALFNQVGNWFTEASWDFAQAEPRMVAMSGDNLVLMLPQTDLETYGDPALKALEPVYCKVPQYQPDPVTGQPVVVSEKITEIAISAHAWYGTRGWKIGKRIAALAEEGCHIRIFHGEAFDTNTKNLVIAAGAEVRTSRNAPLTHQKLLIVSGGYGGNPNGQFVWTGSHNWSNWALGIDDVILRSSNPAIVGAYMMNFQYMWDYA